MRFAFKRWLRPWESSIERNSTATPWTCALNEERKSIPRSVWIRLAKCQLWSCENCPCRLVWAHWKVFRAEKRWCSSSELEEVFRRNVSHSYSNSLILSLEDLQRAKDPRSMRQRHLLQRNITLLNFIFKGWYFVQLAFVTFPLCAVILSAPAAVSLLWYWICLRIENCSGPLS